jgi:2-dehydro-3-deoxygluconokinase
MVRSAFDWTRILQGARVFHTTGITAALSEGTAQAVGESIRAAKRAGVIVSYDLNYRAALWSQEQARLVQVPLLDSVDVLFTTEEDCRRVLGLRGMDYRSMAKSIAEQYGIGVVTITLRGDISVNRNTWTAIAFSGGVVFDDRKYEIDLVDRLGGGDAYAAGFLYGLLVADTASAVRYGNALSALKQTAWGDMGFGTLAEVEALLKGAGPRISR